MFRVLRIKGLVSGEVWTFRSLISLFRMKIQDAKELPALNLGYCPHPVTVYVRGPIKGYR